VPAGRAALGRQFDLSAAPDSHRRARSAGAIDAEQHTAIWSRGCTRSRRPACRKCVILWSVTAENHGCGITIQLPASPIWITAGRHAELDIGGGLVLAGGG